jgi:hypothetical protein
LREMAYAPRRVVTLPPRWPSQYAAPGHCEEAQADEAISVKYAHSPTEMLRRSRSSQ